MEMSRLNFDTTQGSKKAIYEMISDRKRANMVNSRVLPVARSAFQHKPYTTDYFRGEILNDKED